jgi:hypothetical protein
MGVINFLKLRLDSLRPVSTATQVLILQIKVFMKALNTA